MADEDSRAEGPKSAPAPKAEPSPKKDAPNAEAKTPAKGPAKEKVKSESGAADRAPAKGPSEPSPKPAGPQAEAGWLASRWLGWSVAVVIGLAAVIVFQRVTDDKDAEIAGLRAELETASRAVGQYPDAVAALKAVEGDRAAAEAALQKAKTETEDLESRQQDRASELAGVEERIAGRTAALKAVEAELAAAGAALEKARAETAELDSRQKDRAAELAAVEKRFSEQTAALSQSQKNLETELAGLRTAKDELTDDVLSLRKNLQAAMELLEAVSGKAKPAN